MGISKRHFLIDEKDCLIHLPEKPNGFAICILGDKQQYVKRETSYWLQNHERKALLEKLLDEGYTVFYSNHEGVHWGNEDATLLSERLIQQVLKTEILNSSIHVFAEGMGVLLAMNLLNKGYLNLRSAILFNPCFHLQRHHADEKSNIFFYKKFRQEIRKAYHVHENEIEGVLEKQKETYEKWSSEVPLQIYQAVYQAPYSPDSHVRPFLEEKKDHFQSIETTFYMPGKSIDQFIKGFVRFFHKHETITAEK
ncbi:hypothetical protein LGQ02_14080 [Bacillus shivajii]|uniref:hypothetical protein n=1 Tax=Bacillus shivajii TaxID=1983719 RepID=UPI001CFB8B92|nr:hypothetical protein [Bacillus shivajii]UCZ51974.1 hypothetical protein LGQ02_14080 [Bacillus shivajii]